MEADELLQEINKLPVEKRLAIVEFTIKNLREQSRADLLATGAESLYDNYRNDRELTSFTDIDTDSFYEAR